MTICLSLWRKQGHTYRMTLKEGELHIMAGLHSCHCWQECSCEPSNTLLMVDDTTLNFKNEILPEISTLSLSICPSIHPSTYLSIYLSTYLPSIIYLSTYNLSNLYIFIDSYIPTAICKAVCIILTKYLTPKLKGMDKCLNISFVYIFTADLSFRKCE